MKKILSIILAILMIVTSVPVALAAEGDTKYLYLKISDGNLSMAMTPDLYVKDNAGNEIKYEYEYYIGDDTYSYNIPADIELIYWDYHAGGGVVDDGLPFFELPDGADAYNYDENRWYCLHQNGASIVEDEEAYKCEICGEKFRVIYVDWNFGWHAGNFQKMFFDSMGNKLPYEFESIEDNFDLYRISVDAASYWFDFSNNGIHEGAIPEKVDYYEAATKTWSCSHQMGTSGEQTCKGYLCEICDEFYGEADTNAHDWSNLDGICANGCGAVCDHTNQAGVCTICGKNNAVAMLTLEGAQPEYFSTFEDAIDEARRSENEGALVTVLQDINFGGYGENDFAYIEGGSFTIDLNGKKLNSPAVVFSLYKSEIDFIDSVGTAVVDGGEGYAIDVYNANANIYGGTYKGFCGIGAEDGTVIIDGANVKIENYNNWGYSGSAAIKATENGTITVKNSVISTAAEQTILCYNGSVINIEGGTISGSIYYVGGDVCLSGGTFLDGFAVDGGRINELSEFVKDGYAFYNLDGEVVSSNVKTLSEDCTVKAHTHSYADSKCACGYECYHENQTGSACEICGATLHTCDFTGEWKHDSENHWKECTCGAKEQIASHEDTLVQAEAKAPTCSAAGYEAYEYCTACDYTTYEELPKEIFHKDADKNNKCDDCSAELAFEINRNGELLYYDNPYIQGFQALYDAAQDGDVITLLRDVFAYTVYIRKELTYDLNGFNIITASSRSINIYDNVTIRDSVGGGEIHLAVYIGAPCTIEGGMFYSLGVDSGITLDSILSPCAGYYDYKGNAIDTTGKTSIDNAYVIENHTEGDIYNCLGYKCAVCEKYYGEPNPDGHEYTEGVCDLCGYDCPHTETYETVTKLEHFSVQNPDGTWTKATVGVVCRKCYEILEEKEADRADYTEFDEIMAKICEYLDSGKLIDNAYNDYSSTINSIKNNPDIIGSPFQSTPDGYIEELNRMLSKIEAGIADGTMIKADFTYMTSLFDEINALIDNDPNKLIPSESGRFQGIYYGYYMSCKDNGNHSQFDYDQNMAGNNWEGQIEAILAGVKDGTALKADYTAIDEAIEELDEKLSDVNLTEEAKAGLEEIKAQLEEMKKDPSASKADVDELIGELEEYEEELDKAIEDGSAVEVDGLEEIVKINDALNNELTEKYGEEALAEIVEKIDEKFADKFDELYERAEALTGTVAENKEALAEIEAEMKAIFAEAEKCLSGAHIGLEYTVTEAAKCGVNAIESATCTLCGETVTREVENSALTHSFTKYEVTEEAKCGVEGKKVASCDNGCGETDEKAIAALEHIFLDYIYNEDATCEEDGTKTAECVFGCGTTETVTDEGTKLGHIDEDGDKICDECETEIADVCPDCGGPAHEGEYGQYICALRILIKLLVALIQFLATMA